MTQIANFYIDAGLTQPLDDSNPDHAMHVSAPNGLDGDGVLYFGVSNDLLKAQAQSNPGIDPIVISVVDTASGAGVEASHVRLAVDPAGLTTATPGASLSLGIEVLGGTANAIPIYMRWSNSTLSSGTSSELELHVTDRIEIAI